MNSNLNSKIILIRHGESKINTYLAKTKISTEIIPLTEEERDADLTSKGETQALEAKEQITNKKVKFILTSHMYRCLKTTNLIFSDHPSKPEIIALPLLRELFFDTHDIPKNIETIKSQFTNINFELLNNSNLWLIESLISEQRNILINDLTNETKDYDKYLTKCIDLLQKDNYNETKLEINERCKMLKNILKNVYLNRLEEDECIVIVSHAYFISTFIADELKQDGSIINRRKIGHCEIVEHNLN